MAQILDQSFRQKSKEMYDLQDSRFNNNINRVRSSRQQHLENLALNELRRRFTANQRRRLLDTKKTQDLELTKIKLSKIDGSMEIKSSLVNQRNALIHKILVEKLQTNGNTDDFTSPGGNIH